MSEHNKVKVIPLIIKSGLENISYLVHNDLKESILIDPSFNTVQIHEEIKKNKLTLKGILISHAHFDHVVNLEQLCKTYNVKAFINIKDKVIVDDGFISYVANLKPFIIDSNLIN
jgi:glyoxylase-like metal-dependent hydrolase (beta-lactamase superfamily II)